MYHLAYPMWENALGAWGFRKRSPKRRFEAKFRFYQIAFALCVCRPASRTFHRMHASALGVMFQSWYLLTAHPIMSQGYRHLPKSCPADATAQGPQWGWRDMAGLGEQSSREGGHGQATSKIRRQLPGRWYGHFFIHSSSPSHDPG